jgi:hypothetical protein
MPRICPLVGNRSALGGIGWAMGRNVSKPAGHAWFPEHTRGLFAQLYYPKNGS